MIERYIFVSFLLLFLPTTVFAQSSKIFVELNKLEPQEKNCQAYIVVKNSNKVRVEDFTLDLVLFGNDGVINRRLAVNLAPMRANSTSVKVFGVKDLSCNGITRVLINDVLKCNADGAAKTDCSDMIEATSRGPTELLN